MKTSYEPMRDGFAQALVTDTPRRGRHICLYRQGEARVFSGLALAALGEMWPLDFEGNPAEKLWCQLKAMPWTT